MTRIQQSTLKDVAERAGVSPSTASRVLNDRLKMPISADTKARIRRAAEELDYVPNAAARALVGRTTQTIGLVWFEFTDPSQAALAQEVQARVAARGYHLVVTTGDGSGEPDELVSRLIDERRVDGLLVIASTHFSPQVCRRIRSRGAIVVAAGPPPLAEAQEALTAWVAHDNEGGGWLVGRHLGELGHRRFAFVGARGPAAGIAAVRERGFRRGIDEVWAASGASPDEFAVVVVAGDANDFESGRSSGESLAREHPGVTGVFAVNDRVAMGVLHSLNLAGRSTPVDVSVVGYGNAEFTSVTVPGLTTVDVPRARIAELATEKLFAALAGETLATRETVLEPRLVVRASTGPAPRQRG